ncbi:MAG: carboxypeptidase regulatory-like domain-containing protein [Deltaproteobacteria bacterium]|nr:carboxypeptidase regulatory-like domain-containing protein [Deltaproteobacteria bacterium]
MKRNSISGVIIALLLLSIQGCVPVIPAARPFVYDGAHNGRVVDADTGEPIEGVVVLGVWRSEFATPAGGVSDFYDAREAVTDKNGDFSIPGQGARIFSNISPMRALIFKTGYKYEDFWWHSLKKGRGQRMNVKWEGDKPIIPLKKLSMEERRRQEVPFPSEAYRKKKIPLLMKEINKEESQFGRAPYPVEEWLQ